MSSEERELEISKLEKHIDSMITKWYNSNDAPKGYVLYTVEKIYELVKLLKP